MCRRPYVDNGAWLRELVWVGGCVAAAAWASGPSVLASRGHGAVDVVGPVAPPGRASGRGDKGVYTDRRKRPLGAVLGHLCTLLRRSGQAWGQRSVHRSARTAPRRRSGAFVYTVATCWLTRAGVSSVGTLHARATESPVMLISTSPGCTSTMRGGLPRSYKMPCRRAVLPRCLSWCKHL